MAPEVVVHHSLQVADGAAILVRRNGTSEVHLYAHPDIAHTDLSNLLAFIQVKWDLLVTGHIPGGLETVPSLGGDAWDLSWAVP